MKAALAVAGAAPHAPAAPPAKAAASSAEDASFARELEGRRSEAAPATEPAHDAKSAPSPRPPVEKPAETPRAVKLAPLGKCLAPQPRATVAARLAPDAEDSTEALDGADALPSARPVHSRLARDAEAIPAPPKDGNDEAKPRAAPGEAPCLPLAEWLARCAPTAPAAPVDASERAGAKAPPAVLAEDRPKTARPLSADAPAGAPGASPAAATPQAPEFALTPSAIEPRERATAAPIEPRERATAAPIEPRDAKPALPAPDALAATLAAVSTPPTSATAPASPPAQLVVAAPVGTPLFAGTLAASVSLLARDGVQQARLHLHPAELGPIAVQIAIDGTQARVDFTAEAALTRHAIEAGLPELASALRESGLTLAGGGVFHDAGQRPPPRGRDDARDASPERGEAEHEELPPRRPRRIVALGGIDEYA